MKELQGTGVALVTPFTEALTVDTDALRALVRHCINGGLDYLVVLGTTGEAVTLNKREKQLVIDIVVQENKDQLPLVIGMGGNNTQALTEELKAMDLSPFSAVLSVSPYYNKPSQEGIYQHYKAVASASSRPIILYNVPGRTGSNVLPDTVLRLARDCENIIGVKEASGDLEQIRYLITASPEGFLVISGDDTTAKATVEMGGHGVISVLGQAIPGNFSAMMKAAAAGQSTQANTFQEQLLEGMQLIFEEGNPSGIKAMLEHIGICDAYVRLPLVEATAALKSRIADYVAALKLPAGIR